LLTTLTALSVAVQLTTETLPSVCILACIDFDLHLPIVTNGSRARRALCAQAGFVCTPGAGLWAKEPLPVTCVFSL